MFCTLRFFSSKRSLFHNANLFGSCIIHILYTGCAEIKKNNSGAKGLSKWIALPFVSVTVLHYSCNLIVNSFKRLWFLGRSDLPVFIVAPCIMQFI